MKDFVVGQGVDFTAVGHVLLLVLAVYAGGSLLAWLAGYLGPEAMDEAFFPVAGPVDVLNAGEAAVAAFGPQIAAGSQDEAMQPVGGVRIILAYAMIDQHREPKCVTEPDARIDHGIIARAQRLLEPAENVATVRLPYALVQRPHARCLPPVVKAGGQRGRHHAMLPGAPLNGPARSDVIHPP